MRISWPTQRKKKSLSAQTFIWYFNNPTNWHYYWTFKMISQCIWVRKIFRIFKLFCREKPIYCRLSNVSWHSNLLVRPKSEKVFENASKYGAKDLLELHRLLAKLYCLRHLPVGCLTCLRNRECGESRFCWPKCRNKRHHHAACHYVSVFAWASANAMGVYGCVCVYECCKCSRKSAFR